MSYYVLAHISQIKYFLDLILERQSCRELNFLKNELWLGKIWWSMWKLCLVIIQLTFPKENPNLATFDFWWFWESYWWIMIKPWSNDEYHLKMLMLTIVDFSPNIVDFQSSEQLTEQTCDAGLEIWHEHSLRRMRNREIYLRHYKLKFPW